MIYYRESKELEWPSINQLIASGKRAIFVSGYPYEFAKL